MGNGYLLLYKRFESGSLSWPRTTEETADLTEEQYHYLMLGLNPLDPKIKEVTPRKTGYRLCKMEKNKARLNARNPAGPAMFSSPFPRHTDSGAGKKELCGP